MGGLHSGHTSLLDIARKECDRLVVSVFVNPLQFGEGEDLAVYPRDPEGDAEKCRAHGVDLYFAPEDFYPEDFSTRIVPSGVSEGLCGKSRPGHFEGVATVVARLFGLVQPHVAVFGQKDYQQLLVIRRMVRDLALPVEVLGAPLVREADGLAMSSRNVRLSDDDRRRALSLSAALEAMARSGERDVQSLLALGQSVLDVDRLDYLEVVDARDLVPLEFIDRPARILVAAWIASVRLIDNWAL